jgi:MFS superfamily sulfate permease-like transporter
MGQFGGLFGVSEGSGTTLEKFANALKAIPTETSVPTLIVSVAVLATIVGLERVNKKIPGALIAVVGSIAASYFLDLPAHGVTDLGTVPGGLPAFGLPTEVMTLANVEALLPTVISIVVVILAQSAATSRAYAVKYDDSFDENVDLIGLGLANAAAGISGTFVVNGSPTKTEMVDSAGGRSQLAQLTTGVVVLVVLLFLTKPLAWMPNAVLAAVVFLIGIRLIDYHGMADIYRLRMGEFAVAAITAATVVVIGVEQGIILAMALSVVEHIYHSYRPYDTLVGLTSEGRVRLNTPAEPIQIAPGVMVYRFGAGLYYANAARFTAEVLELVEGADPPLSWFVIDCGAIGDVDYSGSDAIRQVLDELGRKNVSLALSDVNPKVRALLDAYGLTSKIGAERIFGTFQDLLESVARGRTTAPGDAAAPPAGPADG